MAAQWSDEFYTKRYEANIPGPRRMEITKQQGLCKSQPACETAAFGPENIAHPACWEAAAAAAAAPLAGVSKPAS